MIQSEVIGGARYVLPRPGQSKRQHGGGACETPRTRRAAGEEECELPCDQCRHVERQSCAARGAGNRESNDREKVVQRSLRGGIRQGVQQSGNESTGSRIFVARVTLAQILDLIIPAGIDRRVPMGSELIEKEELKAKTPAISQNAGERRNAGNRKCIGAGLVTRIVDPAVGLEPAKRFHDSLLDGEFRFPAGGLNFFRVEKDERIVANPAAVAAGVVEPRLQPECRADEADAVVDLHEFRRAEVVDLRVVFRVARGCLAG